MSGELQVVFVYDTRFCRREEDDPNDAVLYFYPMEISGNRRAAICGQLMGMTQFLHSTFEFPKIITLENGKFALKQFGRYVLAVGCSSVTPDWLLEKQSDILFDLTTFFHKDIDALVHSVEGDAACLSAKLAVIMDHYVPASQHYGDLFALTFDIVPNLSLPKSANHIYLSAAIVLQTCMLQDDVLGGLVMYQNKVVAAELLQDVARNLSCIQPYQLPPAEHVKVNFNIPPGVQLFKVYIKTSQLEKMRSHHRTFQSQVPPSSSSAIHNKQSSAQMVPDFEENAKGEAKKVVPPIPEEQRTPDVDSCGSHELKSDLENRMDEAENYGFLTTGKKRKPRFHRSLENLSVYHLKKDEQESPIVVPLPLPHYSSLADPQFPYFKQDGTSISKFYIDYSTNVDNLSDDDDHHEEENIRQCNVAGLKLKTEQVKTEECANAIDERRNPPVCIQNEVSLSGVRAEESNPETMGTVVMEKPLGNRPTELALHTSRNRTRRRWSTFEDMMSPVLEAPVPTIEIAIDDEKISHEKDETKTTIPPADSSLKGLLLSTFRKLSGPSANQKQDSASTGDNQSVQHPPPIFSDTFSLRLGRPGTKVDDSSAQDILDDIVLYIYSLGSMRLLLLLEKSCVQNSELLHSLRNYSATSIADLEISVSNVEEQSMSMSAGRHDQYCFLQYEPLWQTLSTGGRNYSVDFELVQRMHQDFNAWPNINELIIREDDHVMYACKGLTSEVFYQLSTRPGTGLPPVPSDLMGKVPLKAKRRLEMENSILLL